LAAVFLVHIRHIPNHKRILSSKHSYSLTNKLNQSTTITPTTSTTINQTQTTKMSQQQSPPTYQTALKAGAHPPQSLEEKKTQSQSQEQQTISKKAIAKEILLTVVAGPKSLRDQTHPATNRARAHRYW
jgi:hypothetical protein